jgi:hypothetical protein
MFPAATSHSAPPVPARNGIFSAHVITKVGGANLLFCGRFSQSWNNRSVFGLSNQRNGKFSPWTHPAPGAPHITLFPRVGL